MPGKAVSRCSLWHPAIFTDINNMTFIPHSINVWYIFRTFGWFLWGNVGKYTTHGFFRVRVTFAMLSDVHQGHAWFHAKEGAEKNSDLQGILCQPRESKDQTLPIGSRESFIWIIRKTILCLVLDFQGQAKKHSRFLGEPPSLKLT